MTAASWDKKTSVTWSHFSQRHQPLAEIFKISAAQRHVLLQHPDPVAQAHQDALLLIRARIDDDLALRNTIMTISAKIQSSISVQFHFTRFDSLPWSGVCLRTPRVCFRTGGESSAAPRVPSDTPINAEHEAVQAESTIFQVFNMTRPGDRTQPTSFGGACSNNCTT